MFYVKNNNTLCQRYCTTLLLFYCGYQRPWTCVMCHLLMNMWLYYAIIFLPCGFFFLLSFFFFLAYSQPSQIGCLPYFRTWCGLGANLGCRSKMCCTCLPGNTWCKNHQKFVIARLCWAVSSQLRHVLTIGKKILKQQYLFHMASQYGELRPTNGWDWPTSLGYPCKFQRISHLRSVTARHFSGGRQPNFAALNRGRHLYSAARPSRWALTHVSSFISCVR